MASGGGETDLLPFEGATSAVWSYFGFPDKDGKFVEPDKRKRMSVHCKLCAKVVKYTGNTTNLRFHLERSHRPQFQDEHLTITHHQKVSAEVARYSDEAPTQENPLHCMVEEQCLSLSHPQSHGQEVLGYSCHLSSF